MNTPEGGRARFYRGDALVLEVDTYHNVFYYRNPAEEESLDNRTPCSLEQVDLPDGKPLKTGEILILEEVDGEPRFRRP